MSLFHDADICRSILDSLPLGLCVVDLQKRIVFWSDGAEQLTGHLRHEVIGHSCIGEALLHCDQPGCEFCKEDCPVARAMKTSHTAETVGFLHHKSGYEIPVLIRAVPVHNPHGSIIGAAETFEPMQPEAGDDRRENNLKVSGCSDEVTGIATKVLMRSRLRKTLQNFIEVHVPFGILALRVEGLQHFRARLGTEAAFALLRVMARSLQSSLWTTDWIGRWGEDQFLVILNGCHKEAMPAIRERVRHMLTNDGIEWWGERHSLPISIGEATAEPDDSIDSLIERAQKSLETAAAWRPSASVSGKTSGS